MIVPCRCIVNRKRASYLSCECLSLINLGKCLSFEIVWVNTCHAEELFSHFKLKKWGKIIGNRTITIYRVRVTKLFQCTINTTLLWQKSRTNSNSTVSDNQDELVTTLCTENVCQSFLSSATNQWSKCLFWSNHVKIVRFEESASTARYRKHYKKTYLFQIKRVVRTDISNESLIWTGQHYFIISITHLYNRTSWRMILHKERRGSF